MRRSALPPEFWEARRRARNHNRMQRNYGRRQRHGEALRQEEAERLEGMAEEQAAAYQQQREAEREAAKTAAAAQREAVQQALEHGLRVVVDCSFSVPHAAAGAATGADDGAATGDGERGSSSQSSTARVAAAAAAAAAASDREVRSLCKQLQLCAAANKRAPRPVSLQFSSFCGPVRRFAVEGMHADRWPAARCLEQALLELFSGDELVVLSPDAQEPLLSLDPSKVSTALPHPARPGPVSSLNAAVFCPVLPCTVQRCPPGALHSQMPVQACRAHCSLHPCSHPPATSRCM